MKKIGQWKCVPAHRGVRVSVKVVWFHRNNMQRGSCIYVKHREEEIFTMLIIFGDLFVYISLFLLSNSVQHHHHSAKYTGVK